MSDSLVNYSPLVWSYAAMGGLLLIQMLVVDFVGIRHDHIPGSPVPVDHGNFLFRASRAHANTNEGVAAFLLLSLFAVFVQANPDWVNALCWLYVVGRLGHMLFYYLNMGLGRSIAFGLSLLAIIGLLISGLASGL